MAMTAVLGQSFDFKPNQRYPDPAVQDFAPELRAPARLQRVGRTPGDRLALGRGAGVVRRRPLSAAVGDIPNDRILRWMKSPAEATTFRQPSQHRQWPGARPPGPVARLRALDAARDANRVRRPRSRCWPTATTASGSTRRTTSCAAQTAPSGSPTRRSGSAGAGTKATRPSPETSAWRLPHRRAGDSGELTLVTDDLAGPNGLCFTPDEKTLLYIVESRSTPHRRVWACDVVDDGRRLGARRLARGRQRPRRTGRHPLRRGRQPVVRLGGGTGGTGALDGVMVFDPQGQPIGRIALPRALRQPVLRRCSGRNRLFMASSHSLYAVYVNTRGAVY